MNSYYYNYDYTTPSTYSSATTSADDIANVITTILGLGVLFWLVVIALIVLVYVAKWKVFKKANVDGWEALIPIHSDIVEMKLGGMKTYWYFLNLIFICGIGPLIVEFWKSIVLAKSFGKGAGFGVLLALFPFVCYPILAFGSAQYIGPQSSQGPQQPQTPQQPMQQPQQPQNPQGPNM